MQAKTKDRRKKIAIAIISYFLTMVLMMSMLSLINIEDWSPIVVYIWIGLIAFF